MKASYAFPKNFTWGVAAASAQIEGAAEEDGKGKSIWDVFPRKPGKVVNGDTPAVACDHYHRYKQDFQLMKKLGFRNYRLSVAWPRIFPEGRGALNKKGLDFYDRLMDSALANGITPWVTLFHWDLPAALEEEGGWLVRSTAEAFAPYVDSVVKRLGDRVKNWMTLNEIPCFIGLGYGLGVHAPGLEVSEKKLNQAYHHALLAHGHAVRAVREFGGKNARVGLAHNPDIPVPVMETKADSQAARAIWMENTEQIMGPIFHGCYPSSFLKRAGKNAPKVENGDLRLIGQKTDFLGLNVYTGKFAAAGPGKKPGILPFPNTYPLGHVFWLYQQPQSIYWAIRHSAEAWGVRNFYITENGFCADDQLDGAGRILDLDRREYARNYLMAVHRAIQEGFRVHGYFLWSFMDNYEWAEGYAKRFGIVHVNYQTQKRTPKLSAHWYSQVIRENRLL